MYVLSFSDLSDSDSVIFSDILEMEKISSELLDFKQEQPVKHF